MFTELFHTTTISNFMEIQKKNKLQSRGSLNKESNSWSLPSHEDLIYFSCKEQHNLDYIEAANILEDNNSCFLDVGDVHNLIQIKICISYEQLPKYNLIMRHDEDSFLKPILAIIQNTKNPGHYDLKNFKGSQLVIDILNLLPYQIFFSGSAEYTKNVEFLLFSNDKVLNNLLNLYYVDNPSLTCALEKEVDFNILNNGKIQIFYRDISAIGTQKYITPTSTKIGLSINKKGNWIKI